MIQMYVGSKLLYFMHHLDYNASAIDSEVIMQPTDTLLCVEWPALLDDSIPFEPDKSFFVKLTGVDPESPRVVVDIEEVEVIIVDDDSRFPGVSTNYAKGA